MMSLRLFVQLDFSYFHQMLGFINHSHNLRSGFMLNRSVQFPEPECIQVKFLPFCAVNPASYLCNFNFSHWYNIIQALPIKYFFHIDAAVLCNGICITQEQQSIKSGLDQVMRVR